MAAVATVIPSQTAGADKTPTALARATATPKDTLAGSTSTVHIVVKNLGQVPLTTIRIKRPASWVTITSGSSAGWAMSSVSADAIEFTGALVPGKAGDFAIVFDAATSAVDRTASWGVEMSADSGASWSNVPGENNSPVSIQLTEHVLTVGNAVISPASANKGTLTAGQVVNVSVPVTNIGTGTVTPAPSETTFSSDESTPADATVRMVHVTQASSVPSLAPGQTGSITFQGVQVDQSATGVVHLRTRVSNSLLPVFQAAVRTVTVQTAATFSTRSSSLLSTSLSCAPTPANPGHPLQCSIAVDKTGDVAGTLDTGTTLSFTDGAGHSTSAPLASATPFPAGSATLTLQFGTVTVPAGFANGSYPATVAFSGADANGMLIQSPDGNASPDQETFDDAPEVQAATVGSSSTGRPVIGITFTEKVHGTADARNWAITDAAGNPQTVTIVSGSTTGGTSYWTLELSTSPSDLAPGPLTVQYTPGNLADPELSPLYPVTFSASRAG